MKRPALTLLEVVVGLVLMATVLALSLRAMANVRRMSRSSRSQLATVQVADRWLTEQHLAPEGMPTFGAGVVSHAPSYRWSVAPIRTDLVMGVPCEVVRVTIVGPDGTAVRLDTLRKMADRP